MKRISNVYLGSVFIVLLGLSLSILFFLKESQKDKIEALSRHILDDFQKDLAYENSDLLTFSLGLSEDGALKNALLSDDEEGAYSILSAISKRFKEYTHIQTLRLQIFDTNFFIFAQSWGNASVGMPMWWFRDDLEKLKQNKHPKVGIETGRRLTFKATIPIQSGNTYIGYLEVIQFVDEFAKKLRQKGIELFALMDMKYLEQASLMKEFPFLDNYIIANKNFNKKLEAKAKDIDWHALKEFGYVYKNKILYLLEPMYNGDHEEIGKYLLVIPSHTVTYYSHNYQDISIFTRLRDKDVYKVVQLWENPSGSYRNIKDKNLMEWFGKLHDEDKNMLLEEVKKSLLLYSKDELIDIILERKYKEKKVGVIE
jgi:hypothetical protein